MFPLRSAGKCDESATQHTWIPCDRRPSQPLSWGLELPDQCIIIIIIIIFVVVAVAVVRRKDAATIHLSPTVYPVLLILGRLCPSVAEGFNSSLRLEELAPFIMR